MRKNYAVIIVGAGPAGIFCAYEILEENPEKSILLIERGKRVEERHCPEKQLGRCIKCKPYCAKMNGFSGAGAFSDGKLSLYNKEDDDIYVGGNLHKIIGVESTKKMIDYAYNVYLNFGATKDIEGTKDHFRVAQIRKRAQNVGLELINIPICHLGTDMAPKIFQKIEEFLESSGVDIAFETEVLDLIISDNKIKGIQYKVNKAFSEEVYADKVVIAIGRVGAEWLLQMCNNHKIQSSPATIDVGVRYELPDKVMSEINEYLYEGKFIGKPNPFNDKVRTFCQNPSGFVSSEVYEGGMTLVNGHSCKNEKSKNTNLALLVSLNLKGVGDPMEYTRNIARNMNALADGNDVLVQRLGDIKAGKRTWPEELKTNSVEPTLDSAKPGDLSLAMPYRELTDILMFISQLDKVIPGFADDDNLLYGPEIKFYSNKVDLSEDLQTSVEGLYAIGDGCGLTRGLMMATASGVHGQGVVWNHVQCGRI